MASSLNGTGITFSDSTTLSTQPVTSLNGQTGAITNTSLYAIGSYVIGRPANYTNYAVNSTIAGSSLYSVSSCVVYYNGGFNAIDGGAITSATSLVNTGTWRCVSPLGTANANGMAMAGLWVRIS